MSFVNIPFNEDKILMSLIAEEKRSIHWSDRIFGARSAITPVGDYLTRYQKNISRGKRYNIFSPLFTQIVFGIGALMLTILLVILLFSHSSPEIIRLFFAIIYSIFVVLLLRRITDKEKNHKVSFSEECLTVGSITYVWQKLHLVYLVKRPRGRNALWFLILVTDDESYTRYNISNLFMQWGSENDFGRGLAYYWSIAKNG